jgi:hypothetical protein
VPRLRVLMTVRRAWRFAAVYELLSEPRSSAPTAVRECKSRGAAGHRRIARRARGFAGLMSAGQRRGCSPSRTLENHTVGNDVRCRDREPDRARPA